MISQLLPLAAPPADSLPGRAARIATTIQPDHEACQCESETQSSTETTESVLPDSDHQKTNEQAPATPDFLTLLNQFLHHKVTKKPADHATLAEEPTPAAELPDSADVSAMPLITFGNVPVILPTESPVTQSVVTNEQILGPATTPSKNVLPTAGVVVATQTTLSVNENAAASIPSSGLDRIEKQLLAGNTRAVQTPVAAIETQNTQATVENRPILAANQPNEVSSDPSAPLIDPAVERILADSPIAIVSGSRADAANPDARPTTAVGKSARTVLATSQRPRETDSGVPVAAERPATRTPQGPQSISNPESTDITSRTVAQLKSIAPETIETSLTSLQETPFASITESDAVVVVSPDSEQLATPQKTAIAPPIVKDLATRSFVQTVPTEGTTGLRTSPTRNVGTSKPARVESRANIARPITSAIIPPGPQISSPAQAVVKNQTVNVIDVSKAVISPAAMLRTQPQVNSADDVVSRQIEQLIVPEADYSEDFEIDFQSIISESLDTGSSLTTSDRIRFSPTSRPGIASTPTAALSQNPVAALTTSSYTRVRASDVGDLVADAVSAEKGAAQSRPEGVEALALPKEMPTVAFSIPEATTSLQSGLPEPLSSQTTRAIVEAYESYKTDQTETLTIRLDPPELGELTIELTQTSEGLAVRVTAREAVTMDMLLARGNEIEHNLKDQNVGVATMEFMSSGTMNNQTSGERLFGDAQRDEQRDPSRTTSRTASSTPARSRRGTPQVEDSSRAMSFRA